MASTAATRSRIWRSSTTSTACTPTARPAQDGYVGLTRRVVDAANQTGARVGYVSTDWVFDGTGHLVDEEEPPNPVNFYGFMKAASELVVLERADAGFVARVGGVQGLHQTQDSGRGHRTSASATS